MKIIFISDEKKKEDIKIKDAYIEKIYEILKNRRKRRWDHTKTSKKK